MAKLNFANAIIEDMKLELQLMRPELEAAQSETERMMINIMREKKEADEVYHYMIV